MSVSNTASEQHQQEQEMLSNFAIPSPPVSTQQSIAAVAALSSTHALPSIEPPRTLWMGDLDPWLDVSGVQDLWWKILHRKVNVKLIKPKYSNITMNFSSCASTDTQQHSGYCFIEFETFEDAQRALALNGQLLPDIAIPSQQHFPNNPDNQKKYFRLNWASGATLNAPIIQSPEYSLFVGDLSASTTEAHLLAFFQKHYPKSIKTVRVMTDPTTGKSRCFGFVRFTNENERQQALIEMNGVWLGGRPIRVALASPRYTNNNNHDNNNIGGPSDTGIKGVNGLAIPELVIPIGEPSNNDTQHPLIAAGLQQGGQVSGPNHGMFLGQQRHPRPLPPLSTNAMYMQPSTFQPLMSHQHGPQPPGDGRSQGAMGVNITNSQSSAFTDPTNTTVFIGGLSNEASEDTLYKLFEPFGIIQQIKIPPGKSCGFVKYQTREEAESAISSMQGFVIGDNRIRLSWGRISVHNRRFQMHQHNQQLPPSSELFQFHGNNSNSFGTHTHHTASNMFPSEEQLSPSSQARTSNPLFSGTHYHHHQSSSSSSTEYPSSLSSLYQTTPAPSLKSSSSSNDYSVRAHGSSNAKAYSHNTRQAPIRPLEHSRASTSTNGGEADFSSRFLANNDLG
ncbi:RRM protein [Scheffersomyces spartinae]|uniref:RRM protein n=1 Tax=Scheffersomyces spartinae TaxID=45513 RepID=A0A9P8AHD6_9ASCO|nr:RRM protein [Scheffersomyces spartinae]KAG7193227.1 RRM protein [Scheffersomyces spartinae]